ncbi:hypothetical protein JYU20_03175, partial [Bacteroidales bacterium AH-315-I05]|nr:hypothetical protein [Bacteroidales bacterium AH-315-I05]
MKNPEELLKKEGITEEQLSETGKEALHLFYEAVNLSKMYPDNKDLEAQAEQVGEEALKVIREDIQRIKAQSQGKEEEIKKKETRKKRSKEVMDEVKISADQAANCRKTLRDFNKQQRESGKVKPPKKKTITTRLRGSLKSIVNMIPKAKKEDVDVLKKTEKAINRFVSDLKEIWDINKVKVIEDELKEKFEDLKEK